MTHTQRRRPTFIGTFLLAILATSWPAAMRPAMSSSGPTGDGRGGGCRRRGHGRVGAERESARTRVRAGMCHICGAVTESEAWRLE